MKDKVEKQLDNLKRFKANWDGYDAKPVSAEVLEVTKLLVEKIGYNYISPVISPLKNGMVQLEWYNGSKILEIELLENLNAVRYLKYNANAGILYAEEETIDITQVDRIKNLVDWVKT